MRRPHDRPGWNHGVKPSHAVPYRPWARYSVDKTWPMHSCSASLSRFSPVPACPKSGPVSMRSNPCPAYVLARERGLHPPRPRAGLPRAEPSRARGRDARWGRAGRREGRRDPAQHASHPCLAAPRCGSGRRRPLVLLLALFRRCTRALARHSAQRNRAPVRPRGRAARRCAQAGMDLSMLRWPGALPGRRTACIATRLAPGWLFGGMPALRAPGTPLCRLPARGPPGVPLQCLHQLYPDAGRPACQARAQAGGRPGSVLPGSTPSMPSPRSRN